jgi:hypothetical protein
MPDTFSTSIASSAFEAQLAAIAERGHRAGLYVHRVDSTKPFAPFKPAPEPCPHEDAYPNGRCADCGEPVPNFEPDDEAILTDYLKGYAA